MEHYLTHTEVYQTRTARSIYYSDLPITLVSARSPLEMSNEKLQLRTPQIAFNGNLTFTQNQFGLQIIDKNPLASETVSQLLNYISTEFPNVSLNWYSLATGTLTNKTKERYPKSNNRYRT